VRIDPRKIDRQHETLRAYYRALFRTWGPQNWWPAHSRFEVIVGAYLTQNTAWTNVEKALANLRADGVLSLSRIRQIPLMKLEQLIRPSGYFRQKAQRLKTFVDFLDRSYSGSLDRMFERTTPELREELLSLNGVGPETADSILLYAGNHPVFVVDTYTRRVLARHNILPEKAAYEEIRELFQQALASLANREANVELPTQDWAKGLPATAHPVSRMSASKRTLSRRSTTKCTD
jgi:endonuclease III related protein